MDKGIHRIVHRTKRSKNETRSDPVSRSGRYIHNWRRSDDQSHRLWRDAHHGTGNLGPPGDKKAGLAILRKAIEFGVNLIDTADSYGPGTSEELIAEALFPYPADLVIATKGGWERPGPDQWTHNASPKHLAEALEGSLKRLRLECIDIYQLHAPDNVVSFEASVEALARLREQGKIRHIGLSNVTREHV
jgi:pyridoxine 4-dehydrogenase